MIFPFLFEFLYSYLNKNRRNDVFTYSSKACTYLNIAHLFISGIFIGERIPLVVFGMAKVKHVRISAVLSGLKLEATLQNVNASATHRERVKGVLKRKSHETSATAHVGHAMIVLLEGEPPNMQYISEYSSFSRFSFSFRFGPFRVSIVIEKGF